MSAQHLWVAPGDIETDVTDRVQTPKPGADGFRVQTNAEQGSAGSAEMEFDDPNKDFEPVGYNAYRILETETPDYIDPYLFAGHYGEGEDERGPYRTGVSRIVRRNVTDANAVLSRYVIREDEDGDRPQETVDDRMTWLLGTSAMDFLTLAGPIDDQYIDADSTLVPKGDLTDYTPQQILDEFAQQSGRNYYIWWDGLALQYVLVYKFDSDDHLTSDLRFSNVESDVDGETTFFLGLDTKMRKDPSRLASNITVRHANGRVTENDAGTAAEFSRLDRVVDAPLVKTDAIATQQALRMLNQLDDEEYTVIGTVYLPAAKASQFRAGMRAEMKATHLTGMSDFIFVRLLNVTCVQISEDPTLSYALAFEAAVTASVTPVSCAGVLLDLTPQDSGAMISVTAADMGVNVTGGGDDLLALAFMAAGCYGTFLSVGGTLLTNGTGWTNGTAKPGNIGGTHTESNWAYRLGAAGDPEWEVNGGTPPNGNPVERAEQFAVLVPTGSTPTALTVDGGSGAISGSTPGRLLILYRVAEGPSLWSSDPSGADWELLISEDFRAGDGGNAQLWACCAPDDESSLNSNSASSAWWAHCIEVPIT